MSPRALAHLLWVTALLSACSGGSDGPTLERPSWLVGIPIEKSYDGQSDDLLTAGLGGDALATVQSISLSSPATAAELRKLAIYTNYRALVDTSAGGGYKTFFGPNIDTQGQPTLGQGKIAGKEYLAYADSEGWGRENVSMLLQVPQAFDAMNPCLVAAPVSGSRGVYGAVGTTGEWALKRGCAVVYTDRGAGNGGHDLSLNTVTLIDGTTAEASAAGRSAQFVATLNDPNYISRKPGRFALKHAHSQRNPERDWGRDTLRAIVYAFYMLNQTIGQGQLRFTPGNTLVIASSVSNGGGAVLQAAELDSQGLIDGVVAVEPQINLKPSASVQVYKGQSLQASGKPLYDYITLAYLYQSCASLAPSASEAAGAPGKSIFGLFGVDATLGANRCQSLRDAGLVTGATTAEQATSALAKLHENGWEPDSDLLHASHAAFYVPNAVAVTYGNAFKQANVSDELCGFSMGTTDLSGRPVATSAATSPIRNLFSLGNGVPPSNGINLIAERSVGGAIMEKDATSASTNRKDYNFDGALCLRHLLTDRLVAANIAAVSRSGDLHGKPTLIVHGRADALVPVNHTSRPYLGANNLAEGNGSRLRYIEVTHAQHFEAFLGYDAALSQRFVPLAVYGARALDLMWNHLKTNASLPESQVVRTTPRGMTGAMVNPLAAQHVPAIPTQPASADAITVVNGRVTVPE